MRFLFALIFAFIIGSHAFADKVSPYKEPYKFESVDDFYLIEGAGLFPSGSRDALPVGMWDGSKRSDITNIIKDMPVNSSSFVVQDMIKAILLSENNVEELRHYKDVDPGEDLLTLRIYKLIEGGFYKDALTLYNVAVEQPHHKAIAKAGILAMLGTGGKSIACLEMKILGHIESDDDFWRVFKAYCDYTLSDNPSEDAQAILKDTRHEIIRSLAFNENFIFPYAVDDWAQLHILEQNILISEGRIEAPVLDDELLNDIPPRDVVALLSLETLNSKDRVLFTLKARQWGLVETNSLTDAYLNINDQDFLSGLPALFQSLQDEEDNDKTRDIILKALDQDSDYNSVALLPFASAISEFPLKDISDNQMRKILNILYLEDLRSFEISITQYLNYYDVKSENSVFLSNIHLIPLVLNIPESHDFMKNVLKNGIFHKNIGNNEQFNIEPLDKVSSDVDNALKVYEKDSVSDEKTVVLNTLKQLKKSSNNNALGETVLLSIKLLFEGNIHLIDDFLFSDIKDGLEQVELNKFSRKMVIEHHIGDKKGRS
ncbi:MAG: hypothetical protein AB8B83_01220 [Bdellovibrionales bacterium]